MHFNIITVLPELFQGFFEYGVVGRAFQNQLLSHTLFNPRSTVDDHWKRVDDRPYGGGPGMVMMYAPLRDSVQTLHQGKNKTPPVICFSPQGETLTQDKVRTLALFPEVTLICGRYEAIDQRFIDHHVDMELSIGDYILSGGEPAAMVLMDAIGRTLEGVLHHEDSAVQDSFEQGLLDCPHYTRPPNIDGHMVPDVLMSGDHQKIAQWRRQQALGHTFLKRPDLLAEQNLSNKDQALLRAFLEQHKSNNKKTP